MWRSIAKKWTGRIPIWKLKARWLKANGFSADVIESNCFFCDDGKDFFGCTRCPGKLVDRNFSCANTNYNYEEKPVAFYKELLRLNRIRKAEK
jgi:hypothetical protein